MPIVHANDIDINYEVQGEGEPLVLIPYLAADQACYAFQVAEYASPGKTTRPGGMTVLAECISGRTRSSTR